MATEYEEKAAEALKRVLELDSSTEGWKTIKETAHCVVYSKPSPDFKGNIYKTEGTIPASPEQTFQFVYPGVETPRRREWDSALTSSIVIDKPISDVDIIVSRTAPVCLGLISAREFVDLVKVTREPSRIFTASVSVTHPKAPETSGFVRGFNHPNALFCYQVDGKPNETRFLQFVHSDLGGMLPQSLVESAVPSAIAENYPRLKAALAKNDSR